MPDPHDYCHGCDALVKPKRKGGLYRCDPGCGDPLAKLETYAGQPLRSAWCIVNNPPLLTREEFLAAVRELSEDDELVLPSRALVGIDRIWAHRVLGHSVQFVRLRDAFASIPMQPSPTGGDIAFVGQAAWGDEAMRRAKDELFMTRLHADHLQRITAGLGGPGPEPPHD